MRFPGQGLALGGPPLFHQLSCNPFHQIGVCDHAASLPQRADGAIPHHVGDGAAGQLIFLRKRLQPQIGGDRTLFVEHAFPQAQTLFRIRHGKIHGRLKPPRKGLVDIGL